MEDYHKLYYIKNKEKIDKYNKDYYQKNKEKLRLYFINYYKKNKIIKEKKELNESYKKYKKNHQNYYLRHKKRLLEYQKKYYDTHKLERKIYAEIYYFNNRNRNIKPIEKKEHLKKIKKDIVLTFD